MGTVKNQGADFIIGFSFPKVKRNRAYLTPCQNLEDLYSKSSLKSRKRSENKIILHRHYSGGCCSFFPWPSITIIVSVDLTLSILLICQVIVSLSLSIVSPPTFKTIS